MKFRVKSVIKAEDVKLKLLSNQMTQQRVSRQEERLSKAIDERGKKLNKTTQAEENLLNKQEQNDNARVSILSITDRINFSTMSIYIYQIEETKRWLTANDKNIKEYEPGFGKKFIESVKFGRLIFAGFLLFIIKLWAIVLFGMVIYLAIRIYKRKPWK
jgi:hypothetical protein